jgi:esterase/lipase
MNTFTIPSLGYSFVADWYEGSSLSEVLLVLIGYDSTRTKQIALVSALVEKTGMSALVIDYSGHGDSPFAIDETRPAQHFLDAVCAYDWIKSTYPDSSISVIGASYGGYLASRLVSYRTVSKLVLRVPAIYEESEFYSLNRGRLKGNELNHIQANEYRRNSELLIQNPLLKSAHDFKGKALVVIHENDDLVPIETTSAYVKAFGADTYLAKGFIHSINESQISEDRFIEYQDYLSNWLQK